MAAHRDIPRPACRVLVAIVLWTEGQVDGSLVTKPALTDHPGFTTGWKKAQEEHFADGGIFDQIFQAR